MKITQNQLRKMTDKKITEQFLKIIDSNSVFTINSIKKCDNELFEGLLYLKTAKICSEECIIEIYIPEKTNSQGGPDFKANRIYNILKNIGVIQI